jgi:hypothetical protein
LKHSANNIDETPPDPADSPQIADLLATIAALTAQLADKDRRIGELYGPSHCVALKAAASGGYCAETVKNWIKLGRVEGYQEGKKWFVNTQSLAVYLTKLGLRR